MPSDNDKLQQILDNLATTIHNLSPGDVGSMDRALVPLDRANAAIRAWALETALEAMPEKIKASYVPEMGVYLDPAGTSDGHWNDAIDQYADNLREVFKEEK